MSDVVLSVQNLQKVYLGRPNVTAVQGISFDLKKVPKCQTIAKHEENVTKYKYRYLAIILLNSRYNYFLGKVIESRYNYFITKKSTWFPLQLLLKKSTQVLLQLQLLLSK